MQKYYSTILTLSAIFYLISLSSNQSYEVIYIQNNKANYSVLEKQNMPKEMKEKYKEVLDLQSKIKYYHTLEHIKGSSKYQFQKVENAPDRITMNHTTTYKDFGKKLIYTMGGMLDDDEAIKRDMKKIYKWKFEKQTKKILGYSCKRAYYINSSGQKTLAWYTSKIPIMDGPSIYAGLPGLILQIETNGSIILASKIRRKTNIAAIIKIPKIRKLITHEEYKKAIMGKANN